MPTQDTLNTEVVSTGENNNNVPNATGSFKGAWNRLYSTLSPRRHDMDEAQMERGEHETATHPGQGNHGGNAEAGAISLDGPPAEAAKSQQHSPFSSRAFDRLPQPVPVVDVFFGSWWLVSALRTATRPVVIYLSIFWLWTAFFDGFVSTIVVAMYLFRWSLLKAGRDTIPFIKVPIPGKRQLFWGLFRWIQKIWVSPRLAFLNYQDR